MACVEGVGGDLCDRGFERLPYKWYLSSVPATAIASTSTAFTEFFLRLPSMACVSLWAHYCSITMGNSLFASQSPSDGALRLSFLFTMGNYLFVLQSPSNGALRSSFFLRWEIPYLYRSLRPMDLCVRLFSLRWEISNSYRSLRLMEICVRLFFFFVISVNA